MAPGEVGELLTRGPYTLRGYYRAPEHNARSFTPDGFYRTGDLVRVLPSGHLVVEGRMKDQINRGGDKISAEELESHLLAHPAVHDVAVVGMPDPAMGERTCAFLIVRDQAPTLREIKRFRPGARSGGVQVARPRRAGRGLPPHPGRQGQQEGARRRPALSVRTRGAVDRAVALTG